MHFTSYKREVYTQKEFNICIMIFVANKQSFIKSYDLMKLFSFYLHCMEVVNNNTVSPRSYGKLKSAAETGLVEHIGNMLLDTSFRNAKFSGNLGV